VGFIDPAACDETARLGVPRLGTDDDAARLLLGDRWLVLGVGSIGPSAARQRICERYQALSPRWATLVHQRAVVSPTATLAPGVVVFAGAIVNPGAVVGPHCVVNTGAIVEHDCTLGAFSQLGPGAVLGGGVAVGERSFLGLGCRVRDHVQVGADVMVGMGAVVTASVADGQIVMGIPARAVRLHG
jgi:acetyltransferase EpsM